MAQRLEMAERIGATWAAVPHAAVVPAGAAPSCLRGAMLLAQWHPPEQDAPALVGQTQHPLGDDIALHLGGAPA
ncbi:MAG: hypothetical protein O6934_06035, partial [SAR324 cluster bacterium]|nr:hypothetical protein [SAR324 cluster bacterium]